FGACLTPGEFAAMAGAASFDLACAEAADMSPGLATLLGRDKQPGSTILSPLGTSDLLFAGGLIHCCAPVPGGADAWKLAEDYAHAVDREIGEMEAFRNRLPEIRGAASEQEEALCGSPCSTTPPARACRTSLRTMGLCRPAAPCADFWM
ncbi:MAG: hypothetical protein Q4F72_10875, partial [Desulfovibrionaceae bacterium]|nr:hypothetical protein [Desulfovibrionaceae bacterium]